MVPTAAATVLPEIDFIDLGILPVWVGYVAVGWSVLWLIFPLVFKSDLPAAFVLFPIIYGVGMLVTDWQP